LVKNILLECLQYSCGKSIDPAEKALHNINCHITDVYKTLNEFRSHHVNVLFNFFSYPYRKISSSIGSRSTLRSNENAVRRNKNAGGES